MPPATHHQGRVIDGLDDTALVAGDITLTGWGGSPSVSPASGSKDRRGRLSVTAGSTPGANPTVEVTFKEKFRGEDAADLTPFVVVSRGDIVAPTTGFWAVTARSATSFTVTFVGTPTAANVYVLDFEVIG